MTTRFPSPNPSRPKTPDSCNNSLRKSKEIPQRSSVPKSSTPNSSSLCSSFNQKENLQLRSPSISSCSKGSKNFMAPTISAASKVITASPRKKILQERNEVINSVTDSLEFPNKEESMGVVIDEVGCKSEMGFCSQEVSSSVEVINSVTDSLEFPNKEESMGVVIDEVGCKSEMSFCSQEVSSSVEVKRGEFRTEKFQNVPPLSQIAPLDADPSLPPYDPKTNYLSPRPQFLHYRPNPRIEHYLNREGEFLDVGDGRKLEDSFSLESSEDDVTTLSGENDSEEEESFNSEVEELVSENETQFFAEPEPKHELKIKPLTHQRFKISKLIPFLLVLIFAYIYAPLLDSPIISSSMLKDHIHNPSLGVFDDLHLRDYLAVADTNLNGITNKIKHWSTDLIAYFTSLNSLPKDDIGLYHFLNTTPLAVDESIGLDLSSLYETIHNQSIEETESVVSEVAKEGNVEINAEEMETEVSDENGEMEHAENEAEKIEINAEEMELEVLDENFEMERAENEAEKSEMEISEDVREDDIGAQKIDMVVSEEVIDANIVGYGTEKEIIADERRNELEQEVEVKVEVEHTEMEPEPIVDEENYNDASSVAELEQELSLLSNEAPNNEEEVEPENIEEDVNDATSFDSPSEFDEEFETSPGLEMLKSTNYGTMLGLSLTSLVLVSTLVFLYKKPKQIPMVKKEARPIKKAGSVSGSSEIYTVAKGVVGDSASVEVSSSFNNILRKREGDDEQNLSHERRQRRDSAASSSISYGSFTTYERRTAKKGSKEEEVVTPVRRSSRIRNQSTSP